MGLDLIPMGKPKPGYEARFKELFNILQNKQKLSLSLVDKLRGKKLPSRDEVLSEWLSIQTPSYESIRAPRVGKDKVADEWAIQRYENSDKSESKSDFLKKLNGYYVAELAEDLDGVPVYGSLTEDRNVFRGQFLTDCEGLIGEDLVAEAWNTKFADDALDYGNRLMSVADKIAKENNLEYLKNLRLPPDVDMESLTSNLHILYSLAKWLIFYGKNGHGYEASF